MAWNKDADWLPFSNALSQVKFWKNDLKQAEEYLEYVETLRQYKFANFDKFYEEALEDVKESQEGLIRARKKLVETKKRISKQ